MHIPFVRQDLQDNLDIFCLSGRKAKTLIPLRGNRHSKAWGNVGSDDSKPSNPNG